VGSKWGYRYVGDWDMNAGVHEIKDHSVEALTEQLALTRATLGNQFHIYHIHSATRETGVLRDRAVINALTTLRESGVRVGLSTSGPQQSDTIREALEIHVAGQLLFTSMQTTWNLLEQSAGPALAEAAAAGVRVIVKEVLANGRLAPNSGADAAATMVRGVSLELGVSVDQVAFAAALAQPWAWRVLSGAATSAHIRSNITATQLSLLPQEWPQLAAATMEPAQYWSQRSGRPWS